MNIEQRNLGTKKIEVEFRSMFNKKEYGRIKEFLENNAVDLGEDNKDVHFFIMSDKLLKVVDNVSKNNAKVVLKLNKIGKGSDFEELEIPIERKHATDFTKVFSSLDFTDNIMRSFQKRQNYLYKDVEIALKYSDVWGYHLELEIVITDAKDKELAEKKIKEVANELNIKLMTDQELVEFTKKAEEEHMPGTPNLRH
ncbi:MAG: hypothetical protein L6Q29_01760 [Candidatus Pacebacteria bacterium]|nr:hypothetical protein [Candidatus Paceibacterota bacterium]